MNISDLKPRMGNVEIEAEVTDVGEVREFEKYGRPGRVAIIVAQNGVYLPARCHT